jgi:1,4-alpha-glucan branching enzyme
MATRLTQNHTWKNGSPAMHPTIRNSNILRTVAELETRPAAKPVDRKVRVQFKVTASQAKAVSVAGTFNGWDPAKTPLKRNGDGWNTSFALPRGRYEYRFVVDGEWLADPSARESVANPFGGYNSVLSV